MVITFCYITLHLLENYWNILYLLFFSLRNSTSSNLLILLIFISFFKFIACWSAAIYASLKLTKDALESVFWVQVSQLLLNASNHKFGVWLTSFFIYYWVFCPNVKNKLCFLFSCFFFSTSRAENWYTLTKFHLPTDFHIT